MKPIREAFASLFGPSRNDRFAGLLRQLSQTAVEAAKFFRETGGHELKGMIDYEHKGDAIVDEIHELLDNSFILRFDIPDSMRLTDDLDNVIDGMRKVAIHIDVYKAHLPKLRPEAHELIEICEEMLKGVDKLIAMLGEPRLRLVQVREVATVVDQLESKADKLAAVAERKLVAEFSQAGSHTLGFIAWYKLYELLEQMTDDANQCAKLILSLARKEA